MIQNKKFFVKHLSADYGVGGWFCECCAPRNRDSRKRAVRRIKKKVNRILDRIEREE